MKRKKGLYEEGRETASPYRAQVIKQIRGVISKRKKQSDAARKRFFRPNTDSIAAYDESTDVYRERYAQMLGWPLTEDRPKARPKARRKLVATDKLGTIHRLQIETLPGLEMYGLLFTPPGKGPFPLVISQHGGGGTPEVTAGFYDSENYNNMSRRVLVRGVAVFAPQLLLWNEEKYGTNFDRVQVDKDLKQVGSSIAALEIYQIQRSLDYLLKLPQIDESRVGMVGLSYGGFYTLYTAAMETRIKASVSSCFFNNRKVYNWPDMTWFDSANLFLDAEVVGLICPRALYIEIGVTDDLFDYRKARPVIKRAREYYDRLGIGHKLLYKEEAAGHEFAWNEDGIDFLMKQLG